MSFDVERHLGAVERTVSRHARDGRPVDAVTLSRSYETDLDDLWEALTKKERIARWFAPVDGDFRPGGCFQITGNADGEIVKCSPPSKLSLTWEFGGGVSWVDLELTDAGGGKSLLTLTHTADPSPHWDRYGPGAVGVGWEFGFLGLALHLADPEAAKADETTFHLQPEGKAFIIGSGTAWGEAHAASGEDETAARAAAARTTAFYTGQPEPDAG